MSIWPAQLAAREAQSVEGLRRRDFMHEVQVDIDQRRLARGLPQRRAC